MGLTFENVAGIAPNAEFECRSGWRDLIEKAAGEMADYPDDWRVVIAGGKEKMGGLVLSVSYVGRWPVEPVEYFIEDWRKASLAVCEECGSAGRLRLGVVAATRCEDHADFVAPFRDEDGEILDLPPTGGPVWKDGRKASYSPCG
ncbi:hypothetical protein G8E10_24870 [Rhizobiaceae bacterium CRRU44]|uniref:Uncharacterized protein n=1 Tax=Ferranicluibacter rubi TaxID=2715133 RepID=A0AA44CES1_9HYPH|nr:hypothetical protein [Ferranicluibacter rubi]NHT78936.1 hypothetical protein [Ferranicluibacter rubi]